MDVKTRKCNMCDYRICVKNPCYYCEACLPKFLVLYEEQIRLDRLEAEKRAVERQEIRERWSLDLDDDKYRRSLFKTKKTGNK